MTKAKTNGIKIHPAAELFPLMSQSERDDLIEDVRANGVRHKVVFLGDELIDGRNRLWAIQELGLSVEDNAVYYGPASIPDPVEYVLSLNLHRRHLNESQRAMVANRIANLRDGEKKAGTSIDVPSQEQAAKSMHVGVATVQRARAVTEKAVPEIIEAVEQGDVSVSAAAEVAKLPKAEQKKIAKGGAKAVKAAASKQRKAKAAKKPPKERKNQFDVEEIERGRAEEPAEPASKVPAFLKDVAAGTKEGERIVRNVQGVRRDVLAFKDTQAGAWLGSASDIERQCKQLEVDLKSRLYGSPCPVCKDKASKTNCGKCGGRGFLDRRHESMLTNDERKTLEAMK